MAKKTFKDSINPAMSFISQESIDRAEGETPATAEAKRPGKAPEGYHANPLYIENKSKRLQLLTKPSTAEKLRAKEGKGLTIDQITGDATIKNGNFILTIPKYEQLTGLKTSTYQLLDAITVALTESGAKSPTVILPLEEYMKRRGLKDRKEAKTQAKADMEMLRGASFSWEEKRGKKVESYAFVKLADSGEIRRNGDIVFTYGNTFYNILLGYPVMPYPAQLQTLNSKRNPNSYYLLRKIAEHKNMNIGKKNENIIAVKTLLSVAPFIPSYEEVMETDRALTRKIIEPFERDMDALEATLSWNYCHSLDQPLTDEELATMSYSTFEELLIHTEWRSYPDQYTKARTERSSSTPTPYQPNRLDCAPNTRTNSTESQTLRSSTPNTRTTRSP